MRMLHPASLRNWLEEKECGTVLAIVSAGSLHNSGESPFYHIYMFIPNIYRFINDGIDECEDLTSLIHALEKL